MLINGEKFACEACVRGHRVSSCHHQDRPLVHVNKKGRPVSQCHHCRGLRKARASHVKCECQDKGHAKEDCPHEKGEPKNDTHACCCSHGARCTCSVKKEHLDPVLEDIPQLIQPRDSHKRHSNMNSHESKATVFSNGHHKPVHKFNDAHNHLGAPYKVPSRSHTVHGHREIAQRSTDSLPLTKVSRPAQESPLHNLVTTAEHTRQVKSEHNSPLLAPTSMPMMEPSNDFIIPSFDPNVYAFSPFNSDSPASQPNSQQEQHHLPDRFPESWFMTYEQAHQYEPPVGALTDAPAVDWSTFNFDTNNGMFDGNMNNAAYVPSQPPSYASFEQFGHLNPGLTSSSGEISEVEDQLPLSRPDNRRTVSQEASNDLGSQGGADTPDRYRLSSASSYYGTPTANMLASDNVASLDIDDYLRQAEAETRKMQLQSQQHQLQQMQQRPTPSPQPQRPSNASQNFSPQGSSSTVMVEHPFTVHEAQQYAHMNDTTSNQSQQNPAMSRASMADDPAWSMAPDMSNPSMALDDEREDEDWVR